LTSRDNFERGQKVSQLGVAVLQDELGDTVTPLASAQLAKERQAWLVQIGEGDGAVAWRCPIPLR
jgi:hypothetical protein